MAVFFASRKRKIDNRLPFEEAGRPVDLRHAGKAASQLGWWQSAGSEQDQVVPMDQFRAVDVAQQGFDVLRAMAGDAAGFGT